MDGSKPPGLPRVLLPGGGPSMKLSMENNKSPQVVVQPAHYKPRIRQQAGLLGRLTLRSPRQEAATLNMTPYKNELAKLVRESAVLTHDAIRLIAEYTEDNVGVEDRKEIRQLARSLEGPLKAMSEHVRGMRSWGPRRELLPIEQMVEIFESARKIMADEGRVPHEEWAQIAERNPASLFDVPEKLKELEPGGFAYSRAENRWDARNIDMHAFSSPVNGGVCGEMEQVD